MHLNRSLIAASIPLDTSQYLLDTCHFYLTFSRFISIPLDTTPIHRANFLNSLFARYLLDTSNIFCRQHLLDTSRQKLDLSRTQVQYKVQGQPGSFLTQILQSLLDSSRFLSPLFIKSSLLIQFWTSQLLQIIGMWSKLILFHDFHTFHVFQNQVFKFLGIFGFFFFFLNYGCGCSIQLIILSCIAF